MSATDTLRLFDHLFGDLTGYLVAFTGSQRGANNLTDIRQQSYAYPRRREEAASRLIAAGVAGRDAYFGVHLFREAGNRRHDNAAEFVRCLWLDEDDGCYPKDAPEPTAVVHSSAKRRHLYWRLDRPVDSARAVALNRRIAEISGGDRGKAALTSVLRAGDVQLQTRSKWGARNAGAYGHPGVERGSPGGGVASASFAGARAPEARP